MQFQGIDSRRTIFATFLITCFGAAHNVQNTDVPVGYFGKTEPPIDQPWASPALDWTEELRKFLGIVTPSSTNSPFLSPPSIDTPSTTPVSTDKPSTSPPSTDKPSTTPLSTDKPSTSPPSTDKPSTSPPSTDKPSTSPPSTDKPSIAPPPTDKPSTAPPSTDEPPTVAPPSTDKPSIAPPSTEEPPTAPPSIDEPPTAPPSTDKPSTSPVPADTPSTSPPLARIPFNFPPSTDTPSNFPPPTPPAQELTTYSPPPYYANPSRPPPYNTNPFNPPPYYKNPTIPPAYGYTNPSLPPPYYRNPSRPPPYNAKPRRPPPSYVTTPPNRQYPANDKHLLRIQHLITFTQNVIKENGRLRDQYDKWVKYTGELADQNKMLRPAYQEFPKLKAHARMLERQNIGLNERGDLLQSKINHLKSVSTNLGDLSNVTVGHEQKQLQVAFMNMQHQNEILQMEIDRNNFDNGELAKKYNEASVDAQQFASSFRLIQNMNDDVKNEIKSCNDEHMKMETEKNEIGQILAQATTLQADLSYEIVALKRSNKELEENNKKCWGSVVLN